MKNMLEIVNLFKDTKVLIVGDVMIDRYVIGKVNRISPEAPVPIVDLKSEDNRLGGAANVALNVKALGGEPLLCSVIGMDKNGESFRKLLPKKKLNDEAIISSSFRQTTIKTRVIADNQQLLRVDSEDRQPLSEEESSVLLKKVKFLIKQYPVGVILFQDYNKGVLTPKVIAGILEMAEINNIPTLVDPKKDNFWSYKSASLFKPNLKEIQDSLTFEVTPTLSSMKEAAKALNEQLNNQSSLITLSEKGIFYDDGTKSGIVPTYPRSIADVSGAGDTVISIAALCLANNVEMELIAQLANLAGGQVCEKIGVVPVDLDQLIEELNLLKQ